MGRCDMQAFVMSEPPKLSDAQMKAIDALLQLTNEIRRRFEEERNGRAPFEARAECPKCGGTVRYWYREPLWGGMKCDTPECVRMNF